MPDFPSTLGELAKSNYSEDRIKTRTVKDEVRQNLICKLQRGETLFPGVVGFDDFGGLDGHGKVPDWRDGRDHTS